ncbi:MAG: carboxylating nicotinate-nucleotide diphosphorylase [bacterium]
MKSSPLPARLIEEQVKAALAEDLGDAGDITSLATIPPDRQSTAHIRARKDGVLAGIDIAMAAFRITDPAISVTVQKRDGDRLARGNEAMTLFGTARGLLTAERVALNYLGHLSGIASATQDLVDAVAGTGVAISGTRKTTPGLRAFEKHAVRCGGGKNHRFGLYDAVMIKDNHIIAAGGIAPAITAAKQYIGHMMKIEIEVDTLGQLEQALAAGADVILLDNMSTDELRKAVQLNDGKAVLEASGNITLKTVRAIADTGVQVISSGWITHSAPCLDLGMDFLNE